MIWIFLKCNITSGCRERKRTKTVRPSQCSYPHAFLLLQKTEDLADPLCARNVEKEEYWWRENEESKSKHQHGRFWEVTQGIWDWKVSSFGWVILSMRGTSLNCQASPRPVLEVSKRIPKSCNNFEASRVIYKISLSPTQVGEMDKNNLPLLVRNLHQSPASLRL